MLLGYGIIASANGIVTAEFGRQNKDKSNDGEPGSVCSRQHPKFPTCS